MYACQDGIKVTKVQARMAVQDVNQLLLKTKSDELGAFTGSSKTSFAKTFTKPSFWKEISNELHSGRKECFVVSFGNNKNVFYDCDLLISSTDLNSCDFSLQFSKCLLMDKSTIYIDVSDISIRGKQRLMGLLRDMKKFFDQRVLIILSQKNSSELPSSLADYVELYFDVSTEISSPPVSKRSKVCSSPVDQDKNTEEDIHYNESLDNHKIGSQYKELKANLDKLRNDLVHKDIELENLQAVSSEMKNRIENLEAENSKLKNDLADEVGKTKHHEKIIEDRENIIKSVKAQNSVLKETISHLDKSVNCETRTEVSNNVTPHIERNLSRDIKSELSIAERKHPNAGPCEILHTVLKQLRCFATFSDKKYCKDVFHCTVQINDIDKGFEHLKNTPWKGSGQSKKQAKNDALLSCVRALKTDMRL